jgi:diadenosine tetraphosphate (Ap4A) HIT family hydrolase
MTATPCVFCHLPRERIVEENEHAVVVLDGFPVSPGHTLIIPKRHVGSLFEVSEPERQALFALMDSAHARLVESYKPDGFNIGVNDGAAAGQTVPHLHIHLIPRYAGDQPDPRGGVRWVIPEKADYWSGRQL